MVSAEKKMQLENEKLKMERESSSGELQKQLEKEKTTNKEKVNRLEETLRSKERDWMNKIYDKEKL